MTNQDLIKALFTIGMVTLLTANCHGSLTFSGSTNNIYIGVGCRKDAFPTGTNSMGYNTNNVPIRYDDEIAILYLCKTDSVSIAVPLHKEIFIKFQMRDKDGREVAKTPLGELWGSQVDNFPSKPGMSYHDRMTSWEADSIDLQPGYGPLTDVSANQLFQMKDKGLYDLTLEVHLMKEHTQTNGWTWDHVAIPPVTVKVEKP